MPFWPDMELSVSFRGLLRAGLRVMPETTRLVTGPYPAGFQSPWATTSDPRNRWKTKTVFRPLGEITT
jgi:hypothetical protein